MSAAQMTPGPDAYQALKGYGFSPAKAAEIALDARRGDEYAKAALRIALAARGEHD